MPNPKTIFLALALLLIVSCKKDHTCTCVTIDTDGKVAPLTNTTTIAKSTETYARGVCLQNNGTDSTFVTTCKLD